MIKLIAFDLDGVLVEGWGSWTQVHKGLGTYDIAKKHAKSFFEGEITFEEWANLDVNLWNGTSIATIEDILAATPLTKGIYETLPLLKRKYKVGIISGGLKLMADRIAKMFNLDYVIGNTLLVEDDRVCGVGAEVEFEGKGKILADIAERENISLKECAAVGDYVNDIPMFEKAGFSLAFNPKDDRIVEHTDAVVYENDLRNILGYF